MSSDAQPTIVLVHGAFAESASWDDVIVPLRAAGHPVIAAAIALRSLAADAASVSDLVRSIDGPVVLVGHSYGGATITNVAADAGDITALVYIAGYALNPGESCGDGSALAPGGTLAPTLHKVPLTGGDTDLYISQDKYHEQFAADLPREKTALMAVGQRPATASSLAEPSTGSPLWKTVPSWFLFGELDLNIPVGAHRIMAERAGSRGTVEIAGASHVVGMSHPQETAQIIMEAARAGSLVSA